MSKRYRIIVGSLIVLLTLFLSGCGDKSNGPKSENRYSVVDVTGYKTVFNAKPKSVLCYSLTQDTMILGIVPGNYLVAKHYLDKDEAISYISEETKHIKTEFRNFKSLSQEAILKMNPEIIFVPDNLDKGVIETFRFMGIKVIVCRGPNSIKDIKNTIKLMAQAMGEEKSGEKVIAEMDRQLTEISAKITINKEKQPVVMLVSRMRQYGGIGSVYDDMCKHAGIINAISLQGIRYGETVTKESVIASDPDVFLVSAGRKYEEDKDIQFRKEFLEDPAFKGMKGLKQVVGITDRYLYSNSQNCVYAIKGLYNTIYGTTFDMKEEKLIKGY